jgi:hypothetical protein
MIKYKQVLISIYIQELIDLGVEGYDTPLMMGMLLITELKNIRQY